MGVSEKAANWKQRKRINTMSMSQRMQERAAQERNAPFTGEQKCKFCDFKARYKFVRCPACNRLQEEMKL